MPKEDNFSSYHPLVNMVFFVLVLGFAMCIMHPACLLIAAAGAFSYNYYLNGRNALRFGLLVMLPLLLLTALLNPLFNHAGATILAYLPNGNPLTWESVLYGLAAALMLAAVVNWFGCYTVVMTADKFVYLFGRVIPALSLLLSLTLRFIPRFQAQLAQVRLAQRCIGRDADKGKLRRRLKNAVNIFSIMLTWALENAIETADSMKSRGYGLPGRTAFSIYRLTERDKTALLWLAFCGLYIGVGLLSGGMYWRFYPTLKGAAPAPLTISFFAVYLALCLTPLALNLYAAWSWRRQKKAME